MSDRETTPNPGADLPTAAGGGAGDSIAEQLAARIAQAPAAANDALDWAAVAAGYEREARALGQDPAAAKLLYQIGRIYEEQLKNPRTALAYFQSSYAVDPKYTPNLEAARRLAAEVGNWSVVADLLELEAQAAGDAHDAAMLRFERGRVLDERLGRSFEARQIWVECANSDPQNLALAEHLAAIAAAEARMRDLAEAYERCASATTDDALKAAYLAAAGEILEDRLAQPDRAAEHYRRAFALSRKDPAIRVAARRHAERQGRWEDAVDALRADGEELAAAAAGADERTAALLKKQAAGAWYALAKVYAEHMKRDDEAVIALLEARKLAPEDSLVLAELAALYEGRGQWDALAEVLRARARAAHPHEAIGVNLRLAEVYEEKLKNVDEAIACYRAVLAGAPGHRAAVSALGRLYARSGNWDGVLETYLAEMAAASDPKEKAQKCFKAGEILEEKLHRVPEAIERYAETLQLQPGYLPAQKALERLYEKAGRWGDLVAVLEKDLEETRQQDQKVALLSRVARIHEERLGALDKAAECYARILDLVPDHLFAIRSLAAIYERGGKWRELIGLNEREAQLSDDQRQVVSLLHKNCEILEEHLGDEAGAMEAYQKVLTLQPTYLPALKALGRLYAKQQRWTDLIAMYRAEAEVTPSTDAAANLVQKIGELHEQRLGKEDDAVAAYREVLTLEPEHFAALRSLSRIYRARGDWENLIEVLRAEAAARRDPTEQATALFQVAEIWEEKLKSPEQAAEVYEEVARLVPGFSPALRALERLYPAMGRWPDLFELRKQEAANTEGPAKIAALLRLARLAADRLDEAAVAQQACEEVLKVEPSHAGALLLLSRLRAAAKDPAGAAEARARLAARSQDPRATASLLVSAALDKERAANGEDAGAAGAWRRALELDPRDVLASAAVERTLRAQGEPRALAQFYESRREAAADRDARSAWSQKAGEAWERAGEASAALAAYQAAVAEDPKSIASLRAARRLWTRAADWAAVRGALQAEASASRDATSAVSAWLEAGEIAEARFADPDSAIGDYRKALERDPLDARAARKLEELLATRGGAGDLCALREARALAQKDRGRAAEEWMAAAQIALDKLKDTSRAIADLDKVLECRADHAPALELRARLLSGAGRHAEAARDWAARIELGGEPGRLVDAHVALAALYQDQLGDPARAAGHLNAALAAAPEHVEALTRLSRIHLMAENWPAAADALRRLLALPSLAREAQIENGLLLADVQEKGFNDAHGAINLVQRALELAPGHGGAMVRLARLYEKIGDLPGLAAVLEQSAGTATDVAAKVEARLRAAGIFADTVKDRERAIAQYKLALEADPACEAARVALAGLYAAGGEHGLAVEEHRKLLLADPYRLASWHALYKLFEAQKLHDRSFVVAGVLTWLRAADEQTEGFFFGENRAHAPAETQLALDAADWTDLCAPHDRGPLHEALAAIGDQLEKVVPTELAAYEVGRADRLKADHPLHRLVAQLAKNLGAGEFELYQAKARFVLAVEHTEPMSVIVGQDVIRKYHAREQRFLLGRLAARLRAKNAVALKLDPRRLGELLAAAIREVIPGYAGTGRPDDATVKQVSKALSRKARKALQEKAQAIAQARGNELEAWQADMAHSADRAGLLLANDVPTTLALLVKEDPTWANAKLDTTEQVLGAVKARDDIAALLQFAVSDEYFRLRQKLKLAIA